MNAILSTENWQVMGMAVHICQLCNHSLDTAAWLASYPGPAQLSIAFSTVKRERDWYLFSHEWRQERKDGRKGLSVGGHIGPRTAKRARYQVAYYTFLASGRRLSYTPSVKRVVNWTIHKTQPFSSANFRHFLITSSHVRKDTRLSPLFRTASDGKLGRAWVWDYSMILKGKCCSVWKM